MAQHRYGHLANSNLIEQVRALSKSGALVFVSLHWGTEYFSTPSEGQKRTARALIDAGASAILGHHPHVAQTVETYRGRPIFYSLGNFLFDKTQQAQSGIGAVISIDRARQISWRTFARSSLMRKRVLQVLAAHLLRIYRPRQLAKV